MPLTLTPIAQIEPAERSVVTPVSAPKRRDVAPTCLSRFVELSGLPVVGFMTAFPDMIVTFDRLVLGVHGIDFHWTLIGTNTGPDGTGRRVQISGYEEWQMSEAGLVGSSKGHFDTAEYERQLEHGVDR